MLKTHFENTSKGINMVTRRSRPDNFFKKHKRGFKNLSIGLGGTVLGAALALTFNYCSPGRTDSTVITRKDQDHSLLESYDSRRLDDLRSLNDLRAILDNLDRDNIEQEIGDVAYKDQRIEPQQVEPRTLERNKIQDLDSLLEKYHAESGNVNATLLTYNSDEVYRRNLENLSLSNLYQLTHFFENTATFYEEGNPDFERTISEGVRNITIPTSYGDLELYNLGYKSDEDSRNFNIQFSKLTEILQNYRGELASENVGVYTNEQGLPRGVRVIADSDDNISAYQEDYNIDDRLIPNNEFYSDLINNQEMGSVNYVIFPRDSAGMVASVPYGMENVVLEALSVLYGDDNLTLTTREPIDFTEIIDGARSINDGYTEPEPRPERENAYRFDSDANKPDGGREYDPADTMRTRPSRSSRDIMGSHSTGRSSTPVENDGTSYDRPQRPRR